MNIQSNALRLKRLGIDTFKNAIVFLRKDCPICHSEGIEVPWKMNVNINNRQILASINTIQNGLLQPGEVGLSEYAWQMLEAQEGDKVILSHPEPLDSLQSVRSKVYGHVLQETEINAIMIDIVKGHYSDIDIAAFLVACGGGRLNAQEILQLTHAMINTGQKLTWPGNFIVDKHSVGGLPGNRTSLIVVPIVAAFGLTMPKTSSRAITSPAGTADVMEIFAPVNLTLKQMQKVVASEGACITWGGTVDLSPADDILIHVERLLELDSEGQLIASVLSKKIAAGSTHIFIDIPVGPKAKIRTSKEAKKIARLFELVASSFHVQLKILINDGRQPIGRGIGCALEARDVLAVLQNASDAPYDLRQKALSIAASIIEFSPQVKVGEGLKIATDILADGRALKKFEAICQAQGGMRTIPKAQFTQTITASQQGYIVDIHNGHIAKLAKLAGAPHDKTAGVDLHTPLNTKVEKGQPLYTIHANTQDGLDYARDYRNHVSHVILIDHKIAAAAKPHTK